MSEALKRVVARLEEIEMSMGSPEAEKIRAIIDELLLLTLEVSGSPQVSSSSTEP